LDLVDVIQMVNDSRQILQLVPGGYVWVVLVVVEVFVVVVFAVVVAAFDVEVGVDAYLDYDVDDGLAGDLACEEVAEDRQHLGRHSCLAVADDYHDREVVVPYSYND